MSAPSPGLVQSVHDRLVRLAHQRDVEPNLVFSRFAAERLLYRLSASRHADRFVLGAFLLVVWLGEVVRPTRDVDPLGFGDLPAEALGEIFGDICSLEVEPDGLVFPGGQIRIAPIRAATPSAASGSFSRPCWARPASGCRSTSLSAPRSLLRRSG